MTGEGQTTGKPSPCPDPGLIAAHADRRLSGDEAARMDAHIAACPDCYEVFSETVQFGLADELRRKGVLLTFAQRPAFRIAAGFAAAAAAFFVAFNTFFVRNAVSPTSAVPLVTELAQAIGERRFIEPRLTGFDYGRLIVLRSGDTQRGLDAQPPAVLSAVAKIRDRAEKDPSPEALGALGITYLISGDVSAAVKALESATAQDPDNARLLTDLSAAYFARATQTDEPADIPKALESAEKAIALANPPVEAWFNRALALESLHLTDAARKAWEDYLQRDSASGWAAEARQHLERLPAKRQSSAADDNVRVRAALDEGAPAVERLADEDARMLRDYLEGELLPAWADAYLAGHPDANLHREHAHFLGDALLRTTGDAMPRDTARALVEPPPSAESRNPLRSQALGYHALHEANRLYAEAPSCSPFRDAIRELDAGGSPYAAWARRQNVLACIHSSEAQAALSELQALESVAEARGYAQLLGRVRWTQGLIRAMRAELTASLERYRSARDLFVKSRDTESEAVILAWLAENYHLLGESRSAWQHRLQAYERFKGVPTPRLRHAILTEGLLACVDERLPRSALHFGAAVVEVTKGWPNAQAISEAFARRAAIRHALGDDGSASDLREARAWISRISDESHAERIRAEVEATEGEILAGEQPGTAIRSLAQSLAYFQAKAPSRVPALHLQLARAQAAQGVVDTAEEQLLAGIQAMERQRISLTDAVLQVSYFDKAFELFDEMVRLQVVSRQDPEQALAFVERGHARQLADSLAGAADAPLEPAALRQGLPAGLTLVYYIPFEDSLYVWTLSREGSHFMERSLPAAELSRLVAAHRVAIERRASLAAVRQTAARLHDELVRPIIPFIASQRALVFIPDGVLQSTAFASFWNRQTGRYLVDDFLLAVAPSGTAFVRSSSLVAHTQGTPLDAFVVGNPRFDRRTWVGLSDLPDAEAEAAEIAGLYARSELLTGSRATKSAFTKGLRASHVVHYAGHAVASPNAPTTARLLLAPDRGTGDSGALYLRELERSRLPRTRVVVLAACRTAAGAMSRVEGPLNLGRPFLVSGVPDVVASLWDIDDAVSRRFFIGFHRALMSEGEPVAALRKAQLALLRGDDALLAHPASWAAFICMGGLDPHSLSKGVAS